MSNTLCRIVKVYCINSKGHLFQASLLVKPLNNLKSGIQYCGFIRKIESMNDVMIIEPNGYIDAMSKGLYDLTGLTQDEF